jgi:hypothetical protein
MSSRTQTPKLVAIPAKSSAAAAMQAPAGSIHVRGARTHNLKNISLDLPW